MKMRDIILDFTPLLDITLILLFFFILFGHMEVEQAQSYLDAQVAKAEAQILQTQELSAQLEREIAMAESAAPRQGSNIQSMMVFNRSENIKLILDMENQGRELKVFSGDTPVAMAAAHGEITAVVYDALTKVGYTPEDTVLCEFILDGRQPGTAAAYREVREALMVLKGEFPYFYYSETDISMGKE